MVPVWPIVPLPVVPAWPAAPLEAAPVPAACGIRLAARTPAVANGVWSEEVGDEDGAAPCLQWSATCVALVTLKTCPAPALVPVPCAVAPALPEPETPAWPTLPVPAPVEALALAAD